MILELSAFELAIVLAALFAGGFLKGVTGLGLPLIITPPLAWVFGIQVAVPLVAIPTVITNLVFIGKYHHAWRQVIKIWPMVISGLVAIIGGVFFLQHANQSIIAVILSLLAISYVIINFLGYELKVSEKSLKLFGPGMGILAGFFHGTTGVSGPIVVAYLTGVKDLSREAYFQALGFIFLIFGIQQVLGYVMSGIYTVEILQVGLLAVIPILISFYLGIWLHRKLDARKFKMATLLLILISALNLLANNV